MGLYIKRGQIYCSKISITSEPFEILIWQSAYQWLLFPRTILPRLPYLEALEASLVVGFVLVGFVLPFLFTFLEGSFHLVLIQISI